MGVFECIMGATVALHWCVLASAASGAARCGSLQRISLGHSRKTVEELEAMCDGLALSSSGLAVDLERRGVTSACSSALARFLASCAPVRHLNLGHNQDLGGASCLEALVGALSLGAAPPLPVRAPALRSSLRSLSLRACGLVAEDVLPLARAVRRAPAGGVAVPLASLVLSDNFLGAGEAA